MPVVRMETIGRTIDDTSISRRYYMHGPAEEDEVAASIAFLPQVLHGLPYRESSAEEVSEIPGDWQATVIWGAEQQLDTVEYRFNFQAPSAHITQSLETVSFHTATGSRTDPLDAGEIGAPLFGGAINVVIDGGKKRVEGITLAPPAEVFTLTWATEDGFVTPAYQRVIEDVVGTVNAFDYRERPAGSLLLSRVSGGKSGKSTWALEFGFSYIQNGLSIPVGNGIVVDEKKGQHLLWVYYGDIQDANYQDVVPRPVAAYVERVWPESDFSVLGLP